MWRSTSSRSWLGISVSAANCRPPASLESRLVRAEFLRRLTRPCARPRTASAILLLMGVGFCLLVPGCITPLTPEQESDWRWQQRNPEYRLPYPTPP